MSLFIKLKSNQYVSVDYNKLHNTIKIYNEWGIAIKVTFDELEYIKELLRVHLKKVHNIISIPQ